MTNLHIKSITTHPYTVPLKSALKWGQGHQLKSLEHVLICVQLSDDSLGLGEAAPRPSIYGETPDSVQAIIQREFAPRLIGREIQSLADIHVLDSELSIIKNNNTARGALNIALWSAWTKSQNVDLASLLQCEQSQTMLSFILGTGELDVVMIEVESIYASGIRCLKVKVGKDIRREMNLIETIRARYGTDLLLYADANQCLTASNAQDILQQLKDYDVRYCEEPLPAYQLMQRHDLKQQKRLPIIGDDSCFTIYDVKREIAFDTFDIVNIKTARTGYTQSNAIWEDSLVAGKGVMIGSQASSLLGCLHAIMFACKAQIEYPTEGSFYLKTDVDLPQVEIRNGYVDLAHAQARLYDIEGDLLNEVGYTI